MKIASNISAAKTTNDSHCAGLVASIGCPRRLEICNSFGASLPRGRLQYVESGAAAALRAEAYRNYSGPWRMEAA
ncbi:hypothetical protein O0880_14590 [Janthinobacterium sp. SUN118]|uniref:hypothetical protein n=1 Tax=Janthinobacterium sp. SUN118 TaxID=3004100 RepID=UPI0025B274F8|nr:hypothetical protein [Janthinobacterium sp. SUN118]MDN2710650.1 hypothetical protein [Janthinobacterium sp. SUN118]